jgi:hypothetical protein
MPMPRVHQLGEIECEWNWIVLRYDAYMGLSNYFNQKNLLAMFIEEDYSITLTFSTI